MSRELRIKCLVLDHDDTAVKSTPEINYPSFMKALSVLRPDVKLNFEEFTELNFVHGFEDLCTKYFAFTEEEMEYQMGCWREGSETIPMKDWQRYFMRMPELVVKSACLRSLWRRVYFVIIRRQVCRSRI